MTSSQLQRSVRVVGVSSSSSRVTLLALATVVVVAIVANGGTTIGSSSSQGSFYFCHAFLPSATLSRSRLPSRVWQAYDDNSMASAATRTMRMNSRQQKTQQRYSTRTSRYSTAASKNNVEEQDSTDMPSPSLDRILEALPALRTESLEYATSFGLGPSEAALYALLKAVRTTRMPLGLAGQPWKLPGLVWKNRMTTGTGGTDAKTGIPFAHWFTLKDLQTAVRDDFLDAARGTTNNSGWQMTPVSLPRGESFADARMTWTDVSNSLEKGTVILNAAGAHIPALAGPSLAATDATYLPCALNLYVTADGVTTSAPPHTDQQDVCVVQTNGQKRWKVYSNASSNNIAKPDVSVFARGKGDDRFPKHVVAEQCKLLLDVVLSPGDVLFIPAGCPHTTSTVVETNEKDTEALDGSGFVQTAEEHKDNTSIHLTMGIDHYIWELDYLSARRLALRRAGVVDTALLGSGSDVDDNNNYFAGKVNEIPHDVRTELFTVLPLGFLNDDDNDSTAISTQEQIDEVAATLETVSHRVDAETAAQVAPSIWRETVERVREQGVELLDTHRAMYLAALEEGTTRAAEDAMTAHLTTSSSSTPTMTPERMQRLSLFRVKRFYDSINESKGRLRDWSLAEIAVASGSTEASSEGGIVTASSPAALSADWATTLPVSVGDAVEADLAGAFFPATVSKVNTSDGTYDVAFFDGDRETGLVRSQIMLTSPPPLPASSASSNVDLSAMTTKQRKRFLKQQEQLEKRIAGQK